MIVLLLTKELKRVVAQVPSINQEEAWRKTLEKAELVGESTISTGNGGLQKQPDLGMVMSITGTPVKSTFQISPTSSPIISRKSVNKSS